MSMHNVKDTAQVFKNGMQPKYIIYRIVENFWGRKLSQISFFVFIHESFLCENWQPHSHLIGGAKQSTKVFFANFLFDHQINEFVKVFSLESLPQYGSCSAKHRKVKPSPIEIFYVQFARIINLYISLGVTVSSISKLEPLK